MKNIAKALLTARKAFTAVVKTQINPHFKSRYADLQDVFNAVDDALADNGLVVVQAVMCDGTRTWLETRLIHVESGEYFRSDYPLQPGKTNDPQALGGALTYARRYALMALLGIAAEDDDGNTASQQPKPAQKAQEKPAAQKVEYIADMPTMLSAVKEAMKRAGLHGWDKLLHQFAYGAFKEIPLSEYKAIMTWLDTLGEPVKDAEPEKPKKGKK